MVDLQAVERLRIPIWLEARMPLEQLALRRRRSPARAAGRVGVAPGDGQPVLLIPGFLAGDLSLASLAARLRGLGYRPCRAQIRANVDCTERSLGRLERQLERQAERHGRRVWLVGHSRGGAMARILAVRRPDLVAGIVCLGSPLRDQLAIHPLVRAQVALVALLGSVGVPGLFSRGCLGGCCAQAGRDLAAPFPAGVAFVSVYSRSDGVVDWRACLDPAATHHHEVSSSHCGMAVNPAVFDVVAQALGSAGARARRGSALAAAA
jgi:triacylglycerol lipase